MVAVIVADEDMTKVIAVQPLGRELYLSPFAAVYHIEFATHFHHLACRVMASGGFGASASQDVYVEWFHDSS